MFCMSVDIIEIFFSLIAWIDFLCVLWLLDGIVLHCAK